MIEIPIFSAPFRRYVKYDVTRLKILLNNRKSAQKTLQSKMAQKTLFQKIRFFFEYEHITWDFCLFNINKMRKLIELAQHLQSKNNNYHPFVLIGHAKGFSSDKALLYLFNANPQFNFITLNQVLKKVDANEYQK
jgi:hypothetical protein